MKKPFKPDWYLPIVPALTLTVGVMTLSTKPTAEWEVWTKLVLGSFIIFSGVFNLATGILRKMHDDDE